MEQVDVALLYARSGIKVFPCNLGKAPAEKGGNGYKDATTSERTIKAWWKDHPNSLIGAPNDQFVVLDSDDYELCYMGRMLHNQALTKLKELNIINDDVMKVKTISGGTHYYFKRDNISTRLIKCLPFFDLLSSGGYTILPDQTNYIANTDKPWEKILSLPKFAVKEFTFLVDELEEATLAAKRLKIDNRTIVVKEKNSKIIKTVIKKIAPEELPQKNDDLLYEKTARGTNDTIHTSFLVNGKLCVTEGQLNSKLINKLFYNREIQTIIGKHLGLKLEQDRSTQRSIFTHHKDKKPSMGVRWSSEGSYLIIRDFSLFFSNQTEADYDLVRLYTSIKYERSYKPSSTEFVLWFTRLLHECGLLDVQIKKIPEGLSKGESRVLSELYRIDAYKRLYENYIGETSFSVNFAKAWMGVNIGNALGKIKKSLVEKKLIMISGIYDCASTFRNDGFYKTDLIKVI